MKLTFERIIGIIKFRTKYYSRLFFEYLEHKWYKLWKIKTFTMYDFRKAINKLPKRGKQFIIYGQPGLKEKLEEAGKEFIESYNTKKDES